MTTAGNEGEAKGDVDEREAALHQAAEARVGWLHGKADERQAAFGEQGEADRHERLDDERRRDVRQQWRRMMRGAPAPTTRAASTYGSSFTARTWPRTRRAKPGMKAIDRPIIALMMPGPSTPTTAIAISRPGNAMIASMKRMSIVSTQRPK